MSLKGRKRHIVTDTKDHLWHVKEQVANIGDTVAGCKAFEEALKKYPMLLISLRPLDSIKLPKISQSSLKCYEH